MRRTEFFRKGKHSESVFGKKKTDRRTPSEGRKRKNYWTEDEDDERIGAFESHGRGVASKIMAKYAGIEHSLHLGLLCSIFRKTKTGPKSTKGCKDLVADGLPSIFNI